VRQRAWLVGLVLVAGVAFGARVAWGQVSAGTVTQQTEGASGTGAGVSEVGGQAVPGVGVGEIGAQAASAPRVTAYTLPPERYKKARAISKVRLRLRIVDLVYGLVILLLVLRWKLGPKYRDIAEKASARRIVQVLVFAPLLVLTIDGFSLPTEIYGNWIRRVYGVSVQSWGSWFWDWTKGEIISVIMSTLVIWILYGVIRRSPRRWWFYFWLASLPLILAGALLEPLVIDPMFHKFEPLAKKDPALTAELEKMVARAGENIPPERMFWMGAGEKTTALNAYVTGFGPSKRIVVWDTSIANLSTPQIVAMAGHEMGHYVLHHIPKGIAFAAAVMFVGLYVGYRLIGWVLMRWGQGWGIRGIEDWASLPALLLLVSVIATIGGPMDNAFSRYIEHQADQYGLEVTHGLIPDAGQVAAQEFNIGGNVNLSDPEPNPIVVFLFYDHPATPDRIQFCLHYDPWGEGKTGKFVK
jgi:STE24 endopeptidase